MFHWSQRCFLVNYLFTLWFLCTDIRIFNNNSIQPLPAVSVYRQLPFSLPSSPFIQKPVSNVWLPPKQNNKNSSVRIHDIKRLQRSLGEFGIIQFFPFLWTGIHPREFIVLVFAHFIWSRWLSRDRHIPPGQIGKRDAANWDSPPKNITSSVMLYLDY